MAENKKQNTLLHKRSVKKGVLPQGEILQYGEIAVNYNSEEPFLSIRKDGENKEYAKFSADEVIAKMFDEKYVTIEDLEDNEEVIASALNELNDRIESIQGINIGNSKGESSLLQKVEVETFVDENPDSPTNGQEIPTEASGNHSVVLNGKSNASAKRALAHGNRTIAQGENSHTEGHCTQTVCIDEVTNGYAAHAEGYGSMAGGTYSHAEGNKTKTAAPNSHAEGYLSITTPEAESSHAEGYETSTEAPASHTEGNNTKTHKAYSHAEGRQTETFGEASHTEGNETITEGDYAHAEGWMTRAKGAYSHAEGQYTFTYADAAHSEGNNTHAQAPFSHAEGLGTKTNPDIIGQHVEGYYNADSDGVKVIGCGTADDDRINAVEVKQDGRVFVKGLGNFDGTNSNESIDLAGAINNIYDKSETYNKTEIDNRLSTDYYLKSQTNHQISTEINKLATVAKTGFYNDLLDKPTIPSEVTEETVSGWGFTKNKGTVTDVKVNGSSVVDSENGVANITAADLGLSSALKYCGITTTKLTDGDTTNPIVIDGKDHIAAQGCVVFYEDSGNTKEFVFNGTKWELLGSDLTYKVVQNAVSSPNVSGNAIAFIDTISQDANGVITATKKNVDMPIVKGDAENSAKLIGEYSYLSKTYQNNALSPLSVALGGGANAGLKGYYYSKVSIANKQIALSTTQPSVITNSSSKLTSDGSLTCGYSVGDRVSIQFGDTFPFCNTIANIEGNVLTMEEDLPITSDKFVLNISTVTSGAFGITNPFEFIICSVEATYDDSTYEINVRNWNVGLVDVPGSAALAEGVNTYAVAMGAHAEGIQTVAAGQFSHAEGYNTIAIGQHSHSEGHRTKSWAEDSHTEGYQTKTEGRAAHAEGKDTRAIGIYSHAEGKNSISYGEQSHAEGFDTRAYENQSHAEGYNTVAKGNASHTEGRETTTESSYAHAEGYSTTASGQQSHAEGYATIASKNNSHAEGKETQANGNAAHSEGCGTIASGEASHAEGYSTTAIANQAHAEGDSTQALSYNSHAEGKQTIAGGNDSDPSIGQNSHAEGYKTQAIGENSHAEGSTTVAGAYCSHVEGIGRTVNGIGAHAEGVAGLYESKLSTSKPEGKTYKVKEGFDNIRIGDIIYTVDGEEQTGDITVTKVYSDSTSIGLSKSLGGSSHDVVFIKATSGGVCKGVGAHASGIGTITTNDGEAAFGKYNVSNENTIFSVGVGNGVGDIYSVNKDRKNAIEVQSTTTKEMVIGGAEDFETYVTRSTTKITGDLVVQKGDYIGWDEGNKYYGGNLRTNGNITINNGTLNITGYKDNVYRKAIDVKGGVVIDVDTSDDVRAIYCNGDIDTSKGINASYVKASLVDAPSIYCNDVMLCAYNEGGIIIPDSEVSLKETLDNKADKSEIVIPLVNITYNELKDLRDNSKLIPGQQYRITDYVTTTVQENTQSANNQFDIIVTADDVNVLNENARAIQHINDENDYFYNSNLAAWEIKYCLDNDTNKFAWADDSDNGKGVIYYMKDEFNNECPYDFKSILFNGKYTFNTYNNRDATMDNTMTNSEGYPERVYNNIIKPFLYRSINYENDLRYEYYKLNNITFSCETGIEGIIGYCYNNTFGKDCYNNTFGNACYNNTFGDTCSNNTIGNFCYNNTFGNGWTYNIFENGCHNNTFGNGCDSNTFGNGCYNNTFGNNCDGNTIGDDCHHNTFGNGCTYNIFGASKTSPKSHYRYIIFDNGNRYLNLNCTSTTSSSKYYQNVRIGLGVNNAYTYKTINDSNVGQTYETCYKPANSQTITI